MSVTVTEKAAKEVLRFIEEGEYDSLWWRMLWIQLWIEHRC